MFSDEDRKSPLEDDPPLFFNDDPELPIYSKHPSGYPLPQLVSILMDPALPEEKVCKLQPLGVSQNCTFIVDLDAVNPDDLKADDLGSWKGTGTRRTHFTVDETNKAEFRPSAPSGAFFVIIRRYYVHRTYLKFHRCIVELQG